MRAGVKSDDFTGHAALCERRQRVDPQKPATLALTCLEGARLFKDVISMTSQRDKRRGGVSDHDSA